MNVHDLASYYLLLVTDDVTGATTAFTRQGLAGALLAEMIADGSIEVHERRLVAGPERPQQRPHAEFWDRMDDDEKPRTASRCIAVLTGPQGDDPRAAVASRLVGDGALAGLRSSFGNERLPAGDPRRALPLAEQLAAVLEAPDEELDDVTRVLVMLVVYTLSSQRLSSERSVRRQLSKRVAVWRKDGLLPEGLALVVEAVRRNVATAASG